MFNFGPFLQTTPPGDPRAAASVFATGVGSMHDRANEEERRRQFNLEFPEKVREFDENANLARRQQSGIEQERQQKIAANWYKMWKEDPAQAKALLPYMKALGIEVEPIEAGTPGAAPQPSGEVLKRPVWSLGGPRAAPVQPQAPQQALVAPSSAPQTVQGPLAELPGEAPPTPQDIVARAGTAATEMADVTKQATAQFRKSLKSPLSDAPGSRSASVSVSTRGPSAAFAGTAQPPAATPPEEPMPGAFRVRFRGYDERGNPTLIDGGVLDAGAIVAAERAAAKREADAYIAGTAEKYREPVRAGLSGLRTRTEVEGHEKTLQWPQEKAMIGADEARYAAGVRSASAGQSRERLGIMAGVNLAKTMLDKRPGLSKLVAELPSLRKYLAGLRSGNPVAQMGAYSGIAKNFNGGGVMTDRDFAVPASAEDSWTKLQNIFSRYAFGELTPKLVHDLEAVLELNIDSTLAGAKQMQTDIEDTWNSEVQFYPHDMQSGWRAHLGSQGYNTSKLGRRVGADPASSSRPEQERAVPPPAKAGYAPHPDQ